MALRHAFSVEVSHRIEDVEALWRRFTASGVESPGLSYDFIRLWVANRGIASADQHYVVGSVDGQPIAILPLHRRRVLGARVFTWFPGAHTGCYTPVADMDRLAALGPGGRAGLWQAMIGALKGADLAYLRSVPASVGGHHGLFDELGSSLEVETLYRSVFTSWTQCDSEQRSRSRRKHDRQQGDRLAALGDVAFEVITDLDDAHAAVDIMFAQRSARFRVQGIRDTFVDDDLIGFYQDALEPNSGLDVRVHVLRLDDEIVAVRYNIVHGSRMFCLISSMSDSERIQSGSPGKQCLLRVMQSVFDEGMDVFDMGAGHTDEKRHWCNVQVPLRQHYVGLSPLGAIVARAHQTYQQVRAKAKGNDTIKGLRRTLQQFKDRLPGAKPSDQL
ncbi:GNAT family N-acetyltransferase [Devosia sp. XJ19-1]|uniref:GNAT family N-acetyltransferase n=1 Tax=Devosia ureilytica TaxID=2952754 RepID=A0A9Q4ANX2_9HYPH|nr:GNAT family N-acetyltransferase [Devosia ureilytica]MCP8883443.1 GNAT family N-acetyltransferase [Devosia ureilytica]MCP8887051.1 GNAT family N-acetyltransferase [Devosia ureilytica]